MREAKVVNHETTRLVLENAVHARDRLHQTSRGRSM
jgi:hypothetical protein